MVCSYLLCIVAMHRIILSCTAGYFRLQARPPGATEKVVVVVLCVLMLFIDFKLDQPVSSKRNI